MFSSYKTTEISFPIGFLNSASTREIIEMLYCLLKNGEVEEDVFRAKKLLDATIPILVWIRDEKKFPLYPDFISQALMLKWLDQITHKALATFLKLPTNPDYEWHKNINLGKSVINVADMPEQFFINIITYFKTLPEYEISVRLELQSSSAPFYAHHRAIMFFMPVQNIKN